MEPELASSMRPDPKSPEGHTRTADARACTALRWHRLADRPWASGLAGFLTTVMVMLPVEYEAPLRTVMLFVSARRL